MNKLYFPQRERPYSFKTKPTHSCWLLPDTNINYPNVLNIKAFKNSLASPPPPVFLSLLLHPSDEHAEEQDVPLISPKQYRAPDSSSGQDLFDLWCSTHIIFSESLGGTVIKANLRAAFPVFHLQLLYTTT